MPINQVARQMTTILAALAGDGAGLEKTGPCKENA